MKLSEFDRLIGEWRVEGDLPLDPPMTITGTATFERLGELIVFRSLSEAGDVPDSLSVIRGGPDGDPQPMHYFDSRGVTRRYLTVLEGATWTIWRDPADDWNGPDGPGFNQRFIGEISADWRSIDARWERGMGREGDDWELDFRLRYVRR